MSDAPLSREKFIRTLGSSVTNAMLGGGIAKAAQALASRLAATVPDLSATPSTPMENAKLEETPDPFVNTGSPEGNRIALTFDDGPTPGVTDRILNALKQRNLQATFFMIGERIPKAPDLARRVADEGHEIGNHTYTHPKLNSLPDQQVTLELTQTQDIIREVTGKTPTTFRPPYIAFRKNQAWLPHRMELPIIVGDVNSRDWAEPGEDKILETILTQTKAGSIIICHDMHPQTANCIDQLLDGLLERGFKFCTVSSFVERVTIAS